MSEVNETEVCLREAEIRLWKLYRAMTRHEESFFFPTGAAFFKITLDRLKKFKRTGIKKAGLKTDDNVWSTYAERHESVHMLQLVTSPYVFPRAFRLAAIADEAVRTIRGDKNLRRLSELNKEYQSAFSELPQEIMEAQAVTLSLLWLCPGNDAESLLWLANHLYKDRGDATYVRLINDTAKMLGDEAAIRLLPRLCFFALQTDDPPKYLSDLTRKVDSDHATARLLDCELRDLCEWARVDAVSVSRSLRERCPALGKDRWAGQFRHYFDDFEKIDSIDLRLNLLTGFRGADTFNMFKPLVTVFNGKVGYSPRLTHEEGVSQLKTTLDYVEALEDIRKVQAG